MSFSDFLVELLNYDLMQKFHSQSIQPSVGPYALYSREPSSKPGFRNTDTKSGFLGSSKGTGSSQFRHPLPHLSPSSPTATASFDSQSQSPCQICKREGHQALDYFNRMNYSFQGCHPPTELAAMVAKANTTYLIININGMLTVVLKFMLSQILLILQLPNHMKVMTLWA